MMAAWLALLAPDRARAIIDLNGNGMSDIWEMVYGAGGLDPGADNDGAGMTNLQKSIAGLNPFDPKSYFRVQIAPATATSGTSIVLSWPSVTGKSYQMQTSSALLSGTWVNSGAAVAGTGGIVSGTLASSGTAGFYRVLVSDVDSNGDGLSDWESLQLGLNPLNAYSNGGLDPNGQPISDYDYVVTALTSTNSISISATKPSATVPNTNPASDLGTFTLKRAGNLNAITVTLSVSGTAIENTDFAALPRSVTFPIGVNTETVTLTPLASSSLRSGAAVNMTVMSGSSYIMGSSTTAAVIIYPSQTPAGTGLTAQYWPNGGSAYPGVNFTGTSVTRIDPAINFYWGEGQPYTQVNRTNFSASWDGQISPTTSGAYLFALQAHDSARLFISGTEVIDAWALDSSAGTPIQSGTMMLTAGQLYAAHVDYYETTGSAMIYLTWQAPGTSSFAKIPSANVIRTGTTTTGWLANYYNNITETGTTAYSTYESSLYWNWGTGSPDPSIPTTHYSARWTGQIQPQYSETYTFVTHTDDGANLWINDQQVTSNWIDQTASDVQSTPIALQAGVRYDLKMEYFQDARSNAEAHLSWFSPSQPQEYVPQANLYPTSVPAAPSNVTSPTTAVALVGGTFSYTVSASNLASGYSVTGLPAGLTFNPATGIISGTPSPGQAGSYQIVITATNGVGTGASSLTLNIIDTGRCITRDIWTGVAGTQVSALTSGSTPIINTTPSLTGTIPLLQGVTNYGNNYGERIRGYLTAPITGNYYFWLSGSDTAQLWISNDSEPVNQVERASVINGTPPLVWTSGTTQQSPWLALVAGQKYYIEVLHKVGTGSGDNVAVGWLRPDQTGTGPSEIVPGYVLSPYTAPAASGSTGGTLYTASMLAEPGVSSKGVGSATLLLNGTQASVTFSYSNLSSPITAQHIDSDPYETYGSQILFDLAADAPGTYTWKIKPAGPLAVSDILQILNSGQAYFNVLTTDYPNGEISGNFTLAAGAQSFTPPPAPPSWTDDHTTDAGASRFLTQATYGATPSEIARVETMGYSAWIADQFTRPASHLLPVVLSHPQTDPGNTYTDTLMFNAWWQQSITAPDQLRQRAALALSEIMVVSDVGALNNNGRELASYYDALLDNAFGNFRNLMEAVALTPAMGNYLDMRGNAKGSEITGLHPDENFARENMQLFSIGLNRMWPDGSLVENSQGNLVPTYNQGVVQGYAAVYTGWNYNQALQANGRLPTNFNPAADYVDPMVMVPSQHDQGQKQIVDNIVLPQASGSQTSSSQVAYDTYATQDFEQGLNALFNNQNVGPLICRELIQRLVTSNPSPGYVYRVTEAFNDDGTGVRGNMQAVLTAILTDYEARSSAMLSQPGFGKQREPLLRVTAPARYFASTVSVSGSYSQTGTQTILVTSTTPCRLTNGDTTVLNFTSGTPLPTSGNYSVSGVSGTASTTFTVSAMGLLSGTYTQSGSTITASLATHGLQVGNPVYLTFTSGGEGSGLFTVLTVPDTSHITVSGSDSTTRSGNCLISKFTGGYVVASGTLTLDTSSNHGLNPGDGVYIDFSSGTALSGTYTVVSTPDATHFTIATPGLASQSHNSLLAYPLQKPPLNRSGIVTAQTSTFNMGSTDNTITQSPLNSPTVFNFFYPDFSFPGALESAGLTTPEFQLTNASNVMLQTNYLEQGILGSGDQTGLTSFSNGNGTLMMDMGPYLSMASDGNIPNLVDLLNNQLMGGSMSSGMRSAIISYVANETNFPYSSPPTNQQLSNRVRAVVHLILTSPEFTIQK